MKSILLSAIIIFSLFLFSKLNAKIIYADPVRDAKYVNIWNNIIIGSDDAINSNRADRNSQKLVI